MAYDSRTDRNEIDYKYKAERAAKRRHGSVKRSGTKSAVRNSIMAKGW